MVTRTLAILLVMSFVAGSAAVWFADGLTAGDGTETARSPGASLPPAGSGRDAKAVRQPNHTASQDPIDYPGLIEDRDPDSADLAALLRQWALTNPAGFLDALPSFGAADVLPTYVTGTTPYIDALRLASESDPRHALAVGEQSRGELGVWIRSTALEALAAEAPDVALDYLAGLPFDDVRDRLLGSIATGFARADLDAAVAWLSTLGETDGAAFYPVIDALAIVDLSRAIDLDAHVLELDYGGADYGSVQWLQNGLKASRRNPASIANQLASMQSTGFLADTLAWWGLTDPYGAIGWIESQQTISSLVIARMAAELADKDYRAALNLAGQFSPAVRAAWTKSVLDRATAYDLAHALDLIESFRGEPFYADAFARALRNVLSNLGPSKAAEIARDAPPSRVFVDIASRLAESDKLGAANWALSIGDESVRQLALRTVVGSWARDDVAAARNWVLAVPDEALRSTLLSAVERASCVDLSGCGQIR